jgi:hypothetical protein
MGHCGARQPLGVVALSQVGALKKVKPLNVQVIAVHRGDTVWSIAERYGDSGSSMAENVQRILLSNHLDSSAVLQPGQRLRVARWWTVDGCRGPGDGALGRLNKEVLDDDDGENK